MRNVPQNCNDIGRVLFRRLDNYKALSRKYETAIVAKKSPLDSESQPERTELRNQKAGQCQET